MDECRGFIVKGNKCGLCSTHICSLCHKKRLKDHECIEDDKLSVLAIKKECKMCPKCHANVFRISGCSQMWCTNCNTAFDYNSGKMLNTNRIHNPHYTEFLLKNPIRHDENGCVELSHSLLLNKTKDRYIIESYRMSVEIIDTDYLSHIQEKLYKIGHSYLLNKITLEDYKVKIQRIEKNDSKRREENEIRQTWAVVCQDLLRMFIRENKPIVEIKNLLRSNLDIANTSLNKVGQYYKNKPVFISNYYLQN